MPDDGTAGTCKPGLARAMRLGEILAARLCHDLSGTVGTIGNVLELAREDRDAMPEALKLARDSSGELARRLRLMRAVWAGCGDTMTAADLLRMAGGLRSARRLKIDASALQADLRFESTSARLMLGVLLLAEESMPRGGRIALAGDPRREIAVLVEGPQAAWPSGLGLWATGEEAAWSAIERETPRIGPLVALMAHANQMRLSFLLAGEPSDLPSPLLVQFGDRCPMTDDQ